jgi:hypothetical protein
MYHKGISKLCLIECICTSYSPCATVLIYSGTVQYISYMENIQIAIFMVALKCFKKNFKCLFTVLHGPSVLQI